MSIATLSSPRQRRWLPIALTYLVLLPGALMALAPFFWLVSTALKEPSQIYALPPIWIPNPLRWQNFVEGWTALPFTRYALNTALIAAAVTIGEVLSCSIVAFGFARLRAPGRDFLFTLVLATLMIPFQVTMIPSFILFKHLGWINTFLPLIVPFWLAKSGFAIFLLRQFFLTLPRELDDAARIDGAGTFRIFWQILLPLTRPALASVAIFSIVYNWNDFLAPLIYLTSRDNRTLSLALRAFQTDYLQSLHLLMANSLVTLLPLLLLFFFAQRYFIQGIATTGIKG
jgi:ABC-type glycerol-3-phosphate transport system permease component